MDFIDFKTGRFYFGDCLEIMPTLTAGSVDMVLCDLPYGTTACSWDTIIPFDPLWANYWRAIRKNGAVVLFGSEPFSSLLRLSNIPEFKYDWIWHKSRSLGFTNAKNKPMNKHEIISVFSSGTVANKSNRKMLYFPQGLEPYGKIVSGIKASKADSSEGGHKFARLSHKTELFQEFTNYPTSVLSFSNDGGTVHPTQKPVALFEYLIRTYTNPDELVLDNTAGSGTTAIAAMNSGRRWICIEKDPNYFNAACMRVAVAEAAL